MSTKTQKNIKLYGFVALAVAFAVGLAIIQLPNIPLDQLARLLYLVGGVGVLVWYTSKL